MAEGARRFWAVSQGLGVLRARPIPLSSWCFRIDGDGDSPSRNGGRWWRRHEGRRDADGSDG